MSAFFRNIIYIYIYMLHFVKNEEKYFISYEDSKWEFTLNTKNEEANLFYEKLKEKNRIEINFSYKYFKKEKAIFRFYDNNFSLNILNANDYPEPYNIIADNEELGISIKDYNSEYTYSILGKIIGTPETLSEFSSLVSGLADLGSITLVFEIKEDQEEPLVPEIKEDQKEPNNIYLVLFIMFIIFLINCMFINFLA